MIALTMIISTQSIMDGTADFDFQDQKQSPVSLKTKKPSSQKEFVLMQVRHHHSSKKSNSRSNRSHSKRGGSVQLTLLPASRVGFTAYAQCGDTYRNITNLYSQFKAGINSPPPQIG